MITEDVTRENLIEALEAIGWTIASKMNGYAFKIQNHEGIVSPLFLNSEQAFLRGAPIDLCFYYNQCSFEMIGDDTLSLFAKDNKAVFVNFYGKVKS